MRPHRTAEIRGWLDRQPAEALWTTTVPVYEILAGIVASRGATLATRNVRDFDDLGIALVDPWAA